MSATEILDPLSSDDLQNARNEIAPVLKIAKNRMLRLIASAHEEPERAENELLRLLQNKGVEAVVKILDSDFKRKWHFGPMKGAFLVRGSKADSLVALAELPEAMREWKLLNNRSADLTKSHRQALEQEEREFFEERDRARAQGREPPTREQYQERRRKR
ncbi:hypothetical protein C8J34_12214 [Rhizobium sp. PP-F2F-G36]|nr:hypothetical protein C8J34_12214 [Rhizobium sp. PP-F2F-G36]